MHTHTVRGYNPNNHNIQNNYDLPADIYNEETLTVSTTAVSLLFHGENIAITSIATITTLTDVSKMDIEAEYAGKNANCEVLPNIQDIIEGESSKKILTIAKNKNINNAPPKMISLPEIYDLVQHLVLHYWVWLWLVLVTIGYCNCHMEGHLPPHTELSEALECT